MSTTAGTALSFLKVPVFAACVITACGSSARADGSSLPYGRGGMTFPDMNSIISKFNQSNEIFRIEGTCTSSCTELLAIKNVCIDPSATLNFHAALLHPSDPVDPAKNQRMASYYNSKLRSFVVTNHYQASWELHPISGQDMIHKFGYRQCP